VSGNITASDRVDIRSDGSVTGDVTAQRITIGDGAFFQGGMDISKPGRQRQDYGCRSLRQWLANRGVDNEPLLHVERTACIALTSTILKRDSLNNGQNLSAPVS
jgi:hypothetical protein